MRVYIEPTAQKHIMKFVCDEMITQGGVEWTPDADLSMSPLAQKLFQFPFVERVFITANFVAIQKSEIVSWEDIAQDLKVLINEFLQRDEILIEERAKEPYTLYAEMTPNPKVMRFVSNQPLVDTIVEVRRDEDLSHTPIAKALFDEFEYLLEVFVSENYISLTRNDSVEWQYVALEMRQFILDYLQADKELVSSGYVPSVRYNVSEDKVQHNAIEKKIQAVIDEYVQPAVANDGGHIHLVSFDEETRTARMLLQGACSGCPSSTITLKNGIHSILQELLPGMVENVEAVNG
ncbi:MAG: NifU family protein [Weeksellaceae bacterium]|nr:NifU family protein [Weeksellaceae bacterium]